MRREQMRVHVDHRCGREDLLNNVDNFGGGNGLHGSESSFSHKGIRRYDGVLPPVRLKEQSQRFQTYLQEVKRKTPLHPALKWYPWTSLGQFDILDDLLNGDTDALLKMIGQGAALDVGCGDGDISFFLESLGVKVDAVDNAPTNYNALYGVRALKESLQSPLRIQATDIDTHPNFPGAHYGFTLMLGVLYHLKNPFLVLEELARRSDHIFLSTRIAQLAPDRKTGYGGNPVAYLVEDDELNADYTNFWIFTEEGLKRIVRRAGWDITHYATTGHVATSDPVTPKGDARAYIVAKSRLSGRPSGFRLLDGWHHLENERWRWTARKFAIEVDVAVHDSATLQFAFFLPDPVIAQHPVVTLNARVAGQALPPITYTSSGEHSYSARLNDLIGPIRVEFELDRAIGPTPTDPRELGLQVDFSGPSSITIR
jgi:tRNA (mo5U34)-methyltransferase